MVNDPAASEKRLHGREVRSQPMGFAERPQKADSEREELAITLQVICNNLEYRG
ncbi:MAG: hypothetical protein RL410_905 [Actinomycetota bacterium]|jgi:hypothetical protein